jgi:hypothetical protein
MKYRHTWEEVENAGRLYTVELEIDYYVTPFVPAKINCDPDDGHPEEGGEVVIDALKVLSVHIEGASDLANSLVPSNLEKFYWTTRFSKEEIDEDFEHELRDHAAAYEEAAREEADEARREHLRERDE